MKLLINKPYLIFWISIPIIILFGILSNKVLDVNIHDTYYTMSYYHIAIVFAILFGFVGFGYWLMKKFKRKLSKWLNLTHIFLTFGSILIAYIYSNVYSEPKFPLFDDDYRLSLVRIIVMFIILFAQIIYLINISIGIFRKLE